MGIELPAKMDSAANGTAAQLGTDAAKSTEAPLSSEVNHEAAPNNGNADAAEGDIGNQQEQMEEHVDSSGAANAVGNTDEKADDGEEGQADFDGSNEGEEGDDDKEGDDEDDDDDDDDDDDEEDDEGVEFDDGEEGEGEDDDDDNEDAAALREAAKSGINANTMAQLLSKDCLATKALHAAAGENDVDLVKELLDPSSEPHVTVDVTDMFEYTALHVAAERGAVDVIKALAEAGASLEVPSKMYSCRPLHYAAFEGQADAAVALVEAGAEINALTEDKRTPLYLAALRNHMDCVKALLRCNADRTIAGADGKTPAEVTDDPAIADLLQMPSEKKQRVENAE